MKLSIPKKLLIGWARYTVEMSKHPLVFEGREISGFCSPNRKLIKIHQECEKHNQDILHRIIEEIAHGINDQLDIDDESDEVHHILRQWVSAGLMFMKHNIKFMRSVLDFLEEC